MKRGESQRHCVRSCAIVGEPGGEMRAGYIAGRRIAEVIRGVNPAEPARVATACLAC